MSQMKIIIQTLVSMVDAHKKAVKLATEKKEVLIAGDIQKLAELLQRESALVEKIGGLEEQRAGAVEAYMKEQGVIGASFTLQELLSVEKNPLIQQTIGSLAKELRNLVEEISKHNETNQRLIESSLSYLEYSVNMLVPKEPEIGYGPNKRKQQSRSLLDAKI